MQNTTKIFTPWETSHPLDAFLLSTPQRHPSPLDFLKTAPKQAQLTPLWESPALVATSWSANPAHGRAARCGAVCRRGLSIWGTQLLGQPNSAERGHHGWGLCFPADAHVLGAHVSPQSVGTSGAVCVQFTELCLLPPLFCHLPVLGSLPQRDQWPGVFPSSAEPQISKSPGRGDTG